MRARRRRCATRRRGAVRQRADRCRRDGAGDALGVPRRRAGDRSAHRDRPRRGARRRSAGRRAGRDARDRASGQVPRCGGARDRPAPGAAGAHRRAVRARGALRHAARRRSRAIEAYIAERARSPARDDARGCTASPTASPSRSSRWPGSRRWRSASMPMSARAPSRRACPASPTWSSIWCSRARAARDAQARSPRISRMSAASLNAWTARDHTVFHARLLAGDLALGVEMIADLVRAPHLDADELEREKGVVLAELGEARDTPDDIIFDHLQAAAFPGQPLGAAGAGRRGEHRRDRRGRRCAAGSRRSYRPTGLVLAAAGKVDEDALLRLAEARFGDMAAGAPPPPAAGALRRRHASRSPPVRSAPRRAGASRRSAIATPTLSRAGAVRGGGGRRHVVAPVPAAARGSAGSPTASMPGRSSYAETGLFGVYCAAARPQAAAGAGAGPRRCWRETAETLTRGGAGARQGAGQGRAADGAGGRAARAAIISPARSRSTAASCRRPRRWRRSMR